MPRAANLIFSLILCSALLFAPGRAGAQICGGVTPDILLVLDRSGSMSSGGKWTDAKSAIKQLTTQYGTQVNFGLMLFPGDGGSCNAGQIDIPIGPGKANAIVSKLSSTSPSGMTPMASSLKNARTYLKGLNSQSGKYVLLVTDGMANCTPSDPLPEVQALMNAGVKTFVVGFGSGVSPSQLNSLAIAGGTALSGTTKYYQANDATQLTNALSAIIGGVSCCGNGIKESWEKCDTGLPSGAPGSCPTSAATCPKKVCQQAYLSGKACDVVCAYKPVTEPKDYDGCCPPGANYNNDKDCKAECGNGVVEANEICDPGISSGSGKCVTVEDCDDGDACTKDEVIGGACHRTCQYTKLTADLGAKDGCCPAGKSSYDDPDCPPPCGPDPTPGCIDTCAGVDCPEGFACFFGSCKAFSVDPTEGEGEGDDVGDDGQGAGFAKINGEGCVCRAAGGVDELLNLPVLFFSFGLLAIHLSLRRRRRR